MPYLFHFESEVASSPEMTCAELAYRLSMAMPNPAPIRFAAPAPPPSPRAASPKAVPADEVKEEEWKLVAKLGWRYLSEGVVDPNEIRTRLGDDLERVKLAVRRIAQIRGPQMQCKASSEAALHQIIAFGNESFTIAGCDAEFLRFAEKEMQATNIMDL